MADHTVLTIPTRRVDGPLKVTGQAKYAAEYNIPGLLHGYMVLSSIAKGRITAIDSTEARTIPGFVEIFTHENRPDYTEANKSYKDETGPPGEHFKPLASEHIFFSMQPVALVVAESFEAARDAASLVKVSYEAEPHETDLHKAKFHAYKPPKQREGIAPPPDPRGDFDIAYASAPVRLDEDYAMPFEHHNPMEPHATTVHWQGDGKLTIYDKTQGSYNAKQYVTKIFGLKPEDVRLINSFVGGGFGSGLRPQVPLFFATMAAKALERSVRVVMAREQTFGPLVHRPHSIETVKFGAAPDGKLQALSQQVIAGTSSFEDHQEVVVNWVGLMYHAENCFFDHKLARLDTHTPGDMRAPGAVIGQFASECAADELAHQLKLDPIELRLRNYTQKDENDNKKFTSKNLREALKAGAEAFGWSKRTAQPGSMRDGDWLVGWGCATSAYPTQMAAAAARACRPAGTCPGTRACSGTARTPAGPRRCSCCAAGTPARTCVHMRATSARS